jgi:hypothetical protein
MKFPLKIKYIDSNVIKVIEKPIDIEKNRLFVIQSEDIQYGRLSQPSSLPGDLDE